MGKITDTFRLSIWCMKRVNESNFGLIIKVKQITNRYNIHSLDYKSQQQA